MATQVGDIVWIFIAATQNNWFHLSSVAIWVSSTMSMTPYFNGFFQTQFSTFYYPKYKLFYI